jgi:hypothetical protein
MTRKGRIWIRDKHLGSATLQVDAFGSFWKNDYNPWIRGGGGSKGQDTHIGRTVVLFLNYRYCTISVTVAVDFYPKKHSRERNIP